ncbi:MAG TPA: hypothetical protein VGX03_17295 [Candidatus Binatia bacterium]|jgi:hypothetical protein|nr:hypothetical protein [Candidatus Binatia bacterium]
MMDQPNSGNQPPEPVALSIARRELEGRIPFFSRLWEVMDVGEREHIAVPLQQAPLSPGISRKELAELAPFFLRLWWLREYVGSENFPAFGSRLHTLPLGSQYSDPLCDVRSSDIQLF